MAHAWELVSRPAGLPQQDNFALREQPQQPLGPNMVRVRNTYLSVDPYMRPRMDDVPSYIPPFQLNEPLTGGAVGVVEESNSPDLWPGDRVHHILGWRDEAVADAAMFVPLPDDGQPDHMYLNGLSAIGVTAYFGLFDVAAARPGETLFVSAAAGAVGSLVVQMAKARGLRVIGSARGADKCAFVRSIGADVAIDYKAPGALAEKLAAAAPDGIDVYFDNVGGDHLDAALGCARENARFAICGMIDMYNSTGPVALGNLFRVISGRVRIQGFLAGDYAARTVEYRAQMGAWIESGAVVARETIAEGLERTPEAFLALFSGANTGKMLVKI